MKLGVMGALFGGMKLNDALDYCQKVGLDAIELPAGAYPGDPWHAARARMIAACRANGIDAIDGPYPNFTKPDVYRRECTWASTLGAVGKWCIHPSQIEIANDVFAPSEKEIALARAQVEAYQKATEGGEGAASTGGMLVDAASLRLFQAVLDRAKQTGRIE